MKKTTCFLLMLVSLLIVVAGCSQGSTSAGSEESSPDYPEKTIEVILPFPTGGNYDTAGRILMKYAEKHLPNDQAFALVNKPGGASRTGFTEIYNAEPDGYTIGFVQTSGLSTQPHLGNTAYTHDSFQPIMKLLQVDGYMFVDSNAPWETFDEWAEYVKGNPGKFSVSAIPGAVPLVETLKQKGDLDLEIVPFDGFAEATTAFVGGHVDATIGTLSGMRSHLESGDVRPLFTSSGEVSSDVPSLVEKGIDLEENKMVGVIAPEGVSEEKLNILHDAFKKATEDPEFLEEFEQADLELVYAEPDEFQRDISEAYELDKEILETAGMLED